MFSNLPAVRKEAIAVFQGTVIVITILAALVAGLVGQFRDVAPWLVTVNVVLQTLAATLSRANVFSQDSVDKVVTAAKLDSATDTSKVTFGNATPPPGAGGTFTGAGGE